MGQTPPTKRLTDWKISYDKLILFLRRIYEKGSFVAWWLDRWRCINDDNKSTTPNWKQLPWSPHVDTKSRLLIPVLGFLFHIPEIQYFSGFRGFLQYYFFVSGMETRREGGNGEGVGAGGQHHHWPGNGEQRPRRRREGVAAAVVWGHGAGVGQIALHRHPIVS